MYTFTTLPIHSDVSINLLTTGIVIDSKIDEPICIDSQVRLVSSDLGAIEAIVVVVLL